ncbi:MAG: ATP-dependent Clp protease adapter ClpS [Alphaproteobacteria bacterium]|nr:ATP-dependent Clp protease adapter ClpS [Alphaproteobacteria bacterium]
MKNDTLGNIVWASQDTDTEVGSSTQTLVRVARPPLYKVVLLNDDFTPMDFVVYILKVLFHKGHEEAITVMLEVHNKGAGLCGVFTRDVAETKVEQVKLLAQKNEHPLRCLMERE